MLSLKSLFAFAVLVPLVGAAIPAEAAKAAKSNSTAARAECFRQANEAVAAIDFNLLPRIRTLLDKMLIASAASRLALDRNAA